MDSTPERIFDLVGFEAIKKNRTLLEIFRGLAKLDVHLQLTRVAHNRRLECKNLTNIH